MVTAPLGRLLRATLIACLGALPACTVPNHMHVTEGIAPQNIDTNVRFRTTYYFRVFDYCWHANDTLTGGKTYREIVPETDSVFRYVMTGKASALGSRIKFESGTLDAKTIDPFGVDVVYNPDINGHQVRSREDAAADAQRARDAAGAKAAQDGALARFATLSDLHAKAAGTADQPTLDALVQAMKDALAAYTGTLTAPLVAPDHQALVDLKASVDGLGKQVAALAPTPGAPAPGEIATAAADQAAMKVADQVKAEIARLGTPAAPTPKGALCSDGSLRNRGFQIMGPEGMEDFDQNKRLILAMYTSAKPLTETLQEYAGRVIDARTDPAARLLPLVQENLHALEAARALDALEVQAAGSTKPSIDDILAATLGAFNGKKP